MMRTRYTFSPFTADPAFVRAMMQMVPPEVLQVQEQFARAVLAAQLRFVEAVAAAALDAHWTLIEGMHGNTFRASYRPR